MKFALLTNQVRAARRPPLYASAVNATVLTRLFPGLVKPSAPATPNRKNTRSISSLPAAAPNGKKYAPVQIPMDVFGAPDRGSPAGHPPVNGKNRESPLGNDGGASPARSAEASQIPPGRNGASRPIEQRQTTADAARVPPTIPIPKNEATDPQRQSPPPEKQSRPAKPAQPVSPGSPASQEDTFRTTHSALGLRRLLERHPDLPAQSILLGVCDDGLPVVLDLSDPGPGAMVVVGDERERQIELQRNIIDSAASRNSPRSLQFLIISHQPQSWQAWVKERGFSRHCLAVSGGEDENVGEWVLRLADWTEQRRLGQISGPPVLLVMDTLSFLPRLAYDVRLNFDWMAKEGPAARVWPLAAISTDLASSLGIRMLRGFQSRILGYARQPQVYSNLFSLSSEEAGCFNVAGQFGVHVGDRWIHFRLPA